MTTINTFIEKIMQMIAKGDLKPAILEMQKLLKGNPLFDEVILQSGRYNDVMKSVRMGAIDFEAASIEKNKIRYAITDILRELEGSTAVNAEIKKEIQSYLTAQHQNTINNARITGDGNITVLGVSDSQINIQTGNASKQTDEGQMKSDFS